jgi:hypothetical protein
MAFGVKTLGWRKLTPKETHPAYKGEWAIFHEGLVYDTFPTEAEAEVAAQQYADTVIIEERAQQEADNAVDALLARCPGLSRADARRKLCETLRD